MFEYRASVVDRAAKNEVIIFKIRFSRVKIPQ